MIQDLNHVGLSVVSLERALGFYKDLLGMDVLIEAAFGGERYETITGLKGARGRAALLQLQGTGLRVELFEFEYPAPAALDPRRPVCDHGISHFCIGVVDLDSEYQRLKAAGVHFHSAPVRSPTSKVVYGRDPDGNVFELLEKMPMTEQ